MTVSKNTEFKERMVAVTDFWNKNGRFPNRKEKDIRAGNASLTYWVWGLPPMLANGTLPVEWQSALFAAPWWPAIKKRANKLSGDGENASGADVSAVESVEGTGRIDKNLHRKPYTQDMHSKERNPLAVKSREEKEAVAAFSESTVSVKLLSEVGIVDITSDGVVGIGERFFKVGIQRQFEDLKEGADAVAYLVENNIPHRNLNLSRNDRGALLEIEIRVSKLRSALDRLTDLGYLVNTVQEWSAS